MVEGERQSQVACGVRTRPGDEGALRVATPGGKGEGWPGWARALSPPEPARSAGWQRAVKWAGWLPSQVECVVGTRPGDPVEVMNATQL